MGTCTSYLWKTLDASIPVRLASESAMKRCVFFKKNRSSSRFSSASSMKHQHLQAADTGTTGTATGTAGTLAARAIQQGEDSPVFARASYLPRRRPRVSPRGDFLLLGLVVFELKEYCCTPAAAHPFSRYSRKADSICLDCIRHIELTKLGHLHKTHILCKTNPAQDIASEKKMKTYWCVARIGSYPAPMGSSQFGVQLDVSLF